MPVGLYVTDTVEVLDAVTSLMSSARMWAHPDQLGVYRFGVFSISPEEADPELTWITEDFIEENSLELQQPGTPEEVPCYRYDLRHTRNWNPMPESSTLVSLDDVRRKWLAERDTLTSSSEPAGLRVFYPSSEVLEHDTLLVASSVLRYEDSTFLVYEPAQAWWLLSTTGDGEAEFIVPGQGVTLKTTASGTAEVKQTLRFPGGVTGNFRLKLSLRVVGGSLQVYINNAPVLHATTVTATPRRREFLFSLDSADTVELSFRVSGASRHAEVFEARVENADLQTTLTSEVEYRGRIAAGAVERYSLTTDLDFGLQFSCGDDVVLQFDRNDLQQGKQFKVIHKNEQWDDEETELELYRVTERYWSTPP